MGGQLQLHHLAGDEILGVTLVVHLPLGLAGPAEHDVVHVVHRVFPGRGRVGRGPGDHVAAHHQVHLPAGEHRLESGQVAGVGDVHRNFIREQVHVEHIRHRHTHDLAAHQMGLGVFGPAELVNGQVHLVAHVPNGPHNALVGQGKRVERAGEEGHLVPDAHGQAAVLHMVVGDEAADVAQRRGPVIQTKDGGLVFIQEEQQLLEAQAEQAVFLLLAQPGAGEQLAQQLQSLLPHRDPVAGQPAQQAAQQPVGPAAVFLRRLGKLAGVYAVIFQNDGQRVQRTAHNALVGAGEGGPQVLDQLIQLLRRQPEGKLAQIPGNVLGEFVFAHFQALHQLHRDLVALVRGEQLDNAQQRRAGVAPHHHLFAHLDEVAQVGGNVQDVVGAALVHLIRQQLDVHRLDDPGGAGFQVVQEDFAHHIGAVQNAPVHGHIQLQIGEDAVLQEQGGHVVFHRHGRGQQGNAPAAGVAVGQPGRQHLEKAGRRNAQRQCIPQEIEGGKLHQHLDLFVGAAVHRQVIQGVQQGKGSAVAHAAGLAVPVQQPLEELRQVLGQGVGQQTAHHALQRIADPVLVLGGELVVRPDDPGQSQLPQAQGGLLVHVGGVGGPLFAVARVEPGHHLPGQVGRVAADVALPVAQQLIEEIQQLALLGAAQVGGILPENVQIGPDVLPVLLTAGGLQNVAEAPLVRQRVHHVQIVADAQEHQTLNGVVHAAQHHRGQLLHRGGVAGQVHIHAQAAHIILKIVQAGVHKLIPPQFFRVHIVQLGEDDLERIVQPVNAGHLPPVRSPLLLGAEVRIDEQQAFHGQVFRLQVPGGVVGRNVGDHRQAHAGEPLVGVKIVQVGHPLAGLAAVFAQVVPGGRAAHQCQVHRHPSGGQPPGGGHGHIVHARNVAQGAEGGRLVAQAQQLIDVLLPPVLQKRPVFLRLGAAGKLLLAQKGKVIGRVKGQGLPLIVQHQPQHFQIEQRCRAAAAVLGPGA